jgi:hypothetical protein
MNGATSRPVNRRPLWKDPALVLCWGAVALMLALFGACAAREHFQRRSDEQIVALGEWAKAVDWEGNAKDALVRHEAVLSCAGNRRPRSLKAVNAVALAKERRRDLRHSLGLEAPPKLAAAR